MGRNQTSTLVPFNSKVDPAVKTLFDALVSTKAGGANSVHELLKVMLKLYEEHNPQEVEKAKQYIDFMGEKPVKIYTKGV